jgi:hypothetical protein
MNEISAATVGPNETGTDQYVIDGRSSRFTVRAFATGLLAAMGHNPTIGIRDLSGRVKFNPDKLEAGSLKITIKSSSLSVQDDISAKDLREMERLMNQEVLETARFQRFSTRRPTSRSRRWQTRSIPPPSKGFSRCTASRAANPSMYTPLAWGVYYVCPVTFRSTRPTTT